MAALESETADKPARLEEAEAEWLRVVAEVADLREKLARFESRATKLEATNVTLNTARYEAIAGSIDVQEELTYCKLENYKKNIIDDFKSSAKYNAEMGREVGSYLDKGCVHIIRQLHPHFKDKSILLKAFETNFDNEACRWGADFVPFTAKEMDALRERHE